MAPYELRPLIVATILIAVALAARGIPAGERFLTVRDVCAQYLRDNSRATAIPYLPCVPPQ